MSFSSSVKDVISKIAPTLGTVLGGPLGGLAGAAIADALGAKDSEGKIDTKSIEKAILGMDPDTMLKLKQAENDLIVTLRKMDIDVERIAADDRNSARQREISVKDWTPAMLAFVFVTGWFGVQIFLLTHVLDATMREIIMRTLGTMDMALGMILGYYYGTSASSRDKDHVIGEIAKS